MKKILALLTLIAPASFGATLMPIQLLNPAGCASGQVITSTGTSTPMGCATPTPAPVTSVATRTGAVVLSNTDISGLGSAAIVNTGTSGATIPLLNGVNTWGGIQTFSVPSIVPLTGIILGNGASAISAYAGTSCTNQFPRSLSGTGAATCASVANTDLSNSSVTLGSTSVSLGGTASSISGLSLVAPALGAATATSINGNTWTAGTGTLTLGAGKTTTFDHTSTFTTTDGVTYTFPTTTATVARTDAAQTFAGAQTFSGQMLVEDGTAPTPSYSFSNSANLGFYNAGSNNIKFASAGVDAIQFSGASIRVFSNSGSFQMGSSGANFFQLIRDGNNAGAQQNGTNAQLFSTYNTLISTGNYERGVLDWQTSTNVLTIGAQAAGTGTLRTVNLVGAAVQVNGSAITPALSGTTGSIGGGALLAGACTSGTVAVTNSTTAMAVIASPVTYPGDGFDWQAYVSSAGTVTVKVCGFVAGTPTASNYNVRIIQ